MLRRSSRYARRTLWMLVVSWCATLAPPAAWAQKSLELSPTRPTVANSTSVQSKGVLQVETGYDLYPQKVPGRQQAVDTALYYVPWKKVRLDFTWTEFATTMDADKTTVGVGTIQMGTKMELVKEGKFHSSPAIGFQYEAELPTASETSLQGYGQQAILLLNHHFGPINLIVNGSVVQADCQTSQGCVVGGQQSVAISYHPGRHNTLYAESFAQNVSQSNTPPGTYVFAGFLHRFGDAFGIDGGVRFGVCDHSSSIGTTVGLVFGKRLRD